MKPFSVFRIGAVSVHIVWTRAEKDERVRRWPHELDSLCMQVYWM